jgi:ABC-type nitrate/sulfonate/bicarbonate transport system substrate-binding protein
MRKASIGGWVILILTVCFQIALAQEKPSLRFTWRLSPHHIALTDGKFAEKYGLDLKTREFKSGVDVREALITGQMDVGDLGGTPTAVAIGRSKDLVIISVSIYGGGQYRVIVQKESSYQKFDDLRGKKIAIQLGSSCHEAFEKYIKSRGWHAKDFQLVNTGPAEAIAALESKSVDAMIFWEPECSIALAKGIGRDIFNFENVILNPGFMLARRKFVEENAQATTRFLAAYIDACNFINKKQDEAAALVVKSMEKRGQKSEPKVWLTAISHVHYEPWLTSELVEAFKEEYRSLMKGGKIKGEEPIWNEVILPRYLEEAKKMVK